MPISAGNRKTLAILVFEVMEELDAAGPWEAFAWWTRHFPQDGYAVTTFSSDGRPVTCEKGLVIHAHHSRVSVPTPEVFVHPRGDRTNAMLDDSSYLEWIRYQRARVPLMTSVCTGSTVFAAAGILHGRSATSNRNALEV
jgi:putative intracellular protease/amidase